MGTVNGPAVPILSVVLFGLSGLLLLLSALSWSKVARETGRDRPAISIQALRSAAGLTALSFVVLGIAACWLAFTSVSSGS
ncbi:MAG TPA: hypothetical protein VE820_05205 [Sphingomicrobium sp.]|nr:hypothetical protein [Sphingomicrobium sp.]